MSELSDNAASQCSSKHRDGRDGSLGEKDEVNISTIDNLKV